MTYDELKQQLTWTPEVVRGPVPSFSRIVVGGMGGSALPANAIRFLEAALPISIHRDYDLPEDASNDALYIAISYSGNTAETLSFARAAREKGFALAIISSGGELAAFAEQEALPFVQVRGGMQPRNAVFMLLRAFLALLQKESLLSDLANVSFDEATAQQEGDALTAHVAGALPLFYSSRGNGFLAYAGKINFNESGKMPATANIFPEVNHNEMESFDSAAPEAVAALARFVLLRDPADDPRITRRMDVFAELMRERGRTVIDLPLAGQSRAEQLVRGWFVFHLAARKAAESRGVDPETIALVEDFKKRLA